MGDKEYLKTEKVFLQVIFENEDKQPENYTYITSDFGNFRIEVLTYAPTDKWGNKDFTRGRYAYKILNGLYKGGYLIQIDNYQFQYTDETLSGFIDANGVYHQIELRFDADYLYNPVDIHISSAIVKEFFNEYCNMVALFLANGNEVLNVIDFDAAFFKLPEIMFNFETAFYKDTKFQNESLYGQLYTNSFNNKLKWERFNLTEKQVKPYLTQAKKDFWKLVKLKQASLYYSSKNDIGIQLSDQISMFSKSDDKCKNNSKLL